MLCADSKTLLFGHAYTMITVLFRLERHALSLTGTSIVNWLCLFNGLYVQDICPFEGVITYMKNSPPPPCLLGSVTHLKLFLLFSFLLTAYIGLLETMRE